MNSTPPRPVEEEVAQIQRRADQSCSIHAWLRDRYQWRANLLDYSVLALSTYLAGMIFVEPKIGIKLSPGDEPQIWIGCLSLAVFFLSIIQFKSGWRTRAAAHAKSCEEYARVKSDCRALRKNGLQITNSAYDRVRGRYDLAQDLGTAIPEKDFLRGKALHHRKVFVSQYIDTHPGAWPSVVYLKLFLRDNFNMKLLVPHEKAKTPEDQCSSSLQRS